MRTGLALMLVMAVLAFCLPAFAGEAPATPAEESATAAPETATPETGGEEPKPAAEVKGKITISKIFDWGGYIGWIIVVLFTIGVAWLFLCLFRIRRGVIAPRNTARKIEEMFNQKKIREALEYCKKDASVLARMIGAGLSEIRGGYVEMQQTMSEIGDEESIRYHQRVGMFALIAAVAPLFGLLGTVWGMILTFNQIASNPDAMAKPADMADSIQQALVTTCFGLIAAIPNVFFFNLFRNRVVNLMIEASTMAEDLMVRFKGLQPSAAKTTAAAAKAPVTPKAAAQPKTIKPVPAGAKPEEEKEEEPPAEKPEGEKPEGEEPAEKAAEAEAEAKPEEAEAKAEESEPAETAEEEPIEVDESAIESEEETDSDEKEES